MTEAKLIKVQWRKQHCLHFLVTIRLAAGVAERPPLHQTARGGRRRRRHHRHARPRPRRQPSLCLRQAIPYPPERLQSGVPRWCDFEVVRFLLLTSCAIAGLIDANETVEQAGLRELKEETGYTATKVISQTKGQQALDPGLADDTVQFLTVEIDGDLPENQTPIQTLDVGEHVQVVLVACDQIMQSLHAFTEQGVSVEAMLYSFAIGYSMTH